MSVAYTELTLKNEDDTFSAEKGYIKEDEIRRMTVRAVVAESPPFDILVLKM
jgi:hypothetical protein